MASGWLIPGIAAVGVGAYVLNKRQYRDANYAGDKLPSWVREGVEVVKKGDDEIWTIKKTHFEGQDGWYWAACNGGDKHTLWADTLKQFKRVQVRGKQRKIGKR